MDAAWLTWLLDNVPTRLLDALEITALAYVLWVVKTENKKMLALIAKAKTDADASYAPSAVKGDVHDLKDEISNIRDKMDAGFNNISGQISALSNSVIAAVSRK